MSADLRTEAANLKSIDAAGVHVTVNGVEKAVPLGQFVELSRSLPPVPMAGRFALQLAGGDRIGGEPAGIKGEQLLWKSPAVGEMEVSMRLLAGLTRPEGVIRDERRKDDVVTLSNGDTVHGTVADLTSTKITLQTEAGPTDIPLDSLASIAFATAAGGRDKPGFRIRLDDGSSLLGSELTADGTALRLTLPGKAERARSSWPTSPASSRSTVRSVGSHRACPARASTSPTWAAGRRTPPG